MGERALGVAVCVPPTRWVPAGVVLQHPLGVSRRAACRHRQSCSPPTPSAGRSSSCGSLGPAWARSATSWSSTAARRSSRPVWMGASGLQLRQVRRCATPAPATRLLTHRLRCRSVLPPSDFPVSPLEVPPGLRCHRAGSPARPPELSPCRRGGGGRCGRACDLPTSTARSGSSRLGAQRARCAGAGGVCAWAGGAAHHPQPGGAHPGAQPSGAVVQGGGGRELMRTCVCVVLVLVGPFEGPG